MSDINVIFNYRSYSKSNDPVNYKIIRWYINKVRRNYFKRDNLNKLVFTRGGRFI